MLNKIKDFKNKILETKFVKKVIEIYRKLSSNSWVTYVFLLYVIAFLVFGFTLINNSMVIPVSGDFVIQEIPFYYNGYDDWMTTLKTGKFPLWDEQAMLGVNNIGANSFYYLFNIFFLPVLLFPRDLIPQAQAFMIITKIVLAGVGMRKLLEKFNVSLPTITVIGIAYAFCGWNFFYLWFNHFFEIAVLMPFFLLAIEIVLRERKALPLIFTIALVGITNYFFLIAFCFTGVIYALFRYFQRLKDMDEMQYVLIKDGRTSKIHVRYEILLKGIMSFVLGLLLTGVILIPCFDAVLENSRVTEATYSKYLLEAIENKDILLLFRYLSSWEYAESTSSEYAEKYLLFPLVSFFFPNISCYDSPLFLNNGYDNHLSSLNVYTPLTLFLIPSLFQSIKENKKSHLIALIGIIILLFTPFAYYCFSGFTRTAYGRWYIFVVAIFCIYAAINLDKVKEMPKWYFDISIIVVLLFQFYLIEKGIEIGGTASTKKLSDERLLAGYLSMAGALVLYIFYRTQSKKDTFSENLKYLLMIEVLIVCNVVQNMQGTYDYNNDLYGGSANIQEEINLAERIKENDDSFYRVFNTTADRTGTNLGMTLGVRGVGTFHSVFNYNLNEFLSWSQVKYTSSDSGWSMGIHEKRVNLDQFLGIKYYIVKNNDTNVPFGFEEYMSTDKHSVYINTNFVELGTSYTTIYDKSFFTKEYYSDLISNSKTFLNELAYLNGAILSEEDIKLIQEKYNSEFVVKNHQYDNTLLSMYEIVKDGKIYVQRKEDGVLKARQEATSSNRGQLLRGLQYGSIVESEFVETRVCPSASSKNPCYVDLTARMGENLKISLYGENGKLLVSDTHMIHGYDDSNDSKTNRGFYVNEEVKKIRIEVIDNFKESKALLLPYVKYEYYDTFKNNVQTMKENAVKNVEILSSDEIKFDTDYKENRVVVLNVPYDKGWSLYNEKNELVDIYMGQGGFISFVSDKGEHSYFLNYVTPSLNIGMKLTFVGTVFTLAYYCISIYLEEKKRIDRLTKLCMFK